MTSNVGNKFSDRRYFTCLGAGIYLGPQLYPHRVMNYQEAEALRGINREQEEINNLLQEAAKMEMKAMGG